MFSNLSRKYSDEEIDNFRNLLSGSKLPDYMSDIGQLLSNSLKFKSYHIQNDDETTLYTVQIKPLKNTHTIDPNNPVEVAYEAYIFDKDNTWYLENEVVESNKFFPELRQAYNEGSSFKDREADYKYHFDNGDVMVAVSSPSPIDRLDSKLNFVSIEFLGGEFPKKWLLETDDGDYYYLRERSGTIKLISDVGHGDIIFKAFVGGEHPGTNLNPNEVLNFITSVEYINTAEDYNNNVAKEAHDKYWA